MRLRLRPIYKVSARRAAAAAIALALCARAGAAEVEVPIDEQQMLYTAQGITESAVTVLPSDPAASMDAPQLRRLQKLSADEDGMSDGEGGSATSDMRFRMLRSEAMATGAQHALYWRTRALQSQIHALRHFYDRIYNDAITAVLIRFRDYYIVPPVISSTEGGMRKNDSGRVLRIAEKTFRIERDPYLVVNPPTWRDYLLYAVPKPQPPHKALLPRTAEEQEIWSAAVAQGWAAGLRQADSNMRIHLARLTRDIVGMIRYHMLRMRNMVSKPIVDVKYTPVSGGGRRMSLEDSVIRITSDPALNANRDSWKPIPALPDTRWLFPKDYLQYRGVAE